MLVVLFVECFVSVFWCDVVLGVFDEFFEEVLFDDVEFGVELFLFVLFVCDESFGCCVE